MSDREPLETLENGECWYNEGGAATRAEGPIEIYPGWVRIGGPTPVWLPRERVEQVIRL